MKKVLEAIKKFIIGLVGTAYFIFALIMTILLLNFNEYGVTQFGKTSMVIIPDDMSEKYTLTDEFGNHYAVSEAK